MTATIQNKEEGECLQWIRFIIIRQLYYVQGKNLSEIAAVVSCDWRTARKYVIKEDFNPCGKDPQNKGPRSSKLDPYKTKIDDWLLEDKKALRKRRQKTRRVYIRLKEEAEDFNASYCLMAEYVSARKKELNLYDEPVIAPLTHQPGEAQADFGIVYFYENKTADIIRTASI